MCGKIPYVIITDCFSLSICSVEFEVIPCVGGFQTDYSVVQKPQRAAVHYWL